MSCLGELRDDFIEAGAFGDGDDVGARHGDVVDRLLAEMEQVAQHLALDRRHIADDITTAPVVPLFLGLVDHLFDLLTQRRFLVAAEQQCPKPGPQAGPTVLFRSVEDPWSSGIKVAVP